MLTTKVECKIYQEIWWTGHCAVCYTIDPKYDDEVKIVEKRGSSVCSAKRGGTGKEGKGLYRQLFSSEGQRDGGFRCRYDHHQGYERTDSSRTCATLVSLFKKELEVPVDFHTHFTPGYGLASVLAAIVNGVDIVDTNIWNFAGSGCAWPLS